MTSSTPSMKTLDSFLTACVPNEEPPKRRTSAVSGSTQLSQTPTVLGTIEDTFDNFIKSITDIPSTIEETFDDLVKTVTDIPSSLEETLDEFIQTINEYVHSRQLLT